MQIRNQKSQIENGTVVCLQHKSRILENNPAGDPHIRDLYVYLPPNYDESLRYPSVYVLSGFTGRGKMLLNDSAFTPNFAERMDRLIATERIRPMIAVLPDCFTRFGGSQYLNSTATGNYESYLTDEIVGFVHATFRTLPDRASRAVIGKSSGGYGVLIMAMRHADRFGLVCSTAGDAYFECCYLPDFVKAYRAIKGRPRRADRKDGTRKRKGEHGFDGLNLIGMSACYSPNGTWDSIFRSISRRANCDRTFGRNGSKTIRYDLWKSLWKLAVPEFALHRRRHQRRVRARRRRRVFGLKTSGF
ncbi:MAG: hypothetical protein IPK58_13220 [Acidobacteria bacterium]|nr:hypothetical protein [Acidobacteriota bacterium]